jgi:hypothetical protein
VIRGRNREAIERLPELLEGGTLGIIDRQEDIFESIVRMRLRQLTNQHFVGNLAGLVPYLSRRLQIVRLRLAAVGPK